MTYLELENILIKKMKVFYPECIHYMATVVNQNHYVASKGFKKRIEISIAASYKSDHKEMEYIFYYANSVAEVLSLLDQKIYGYTKTTKLEPNPENNEQ